VKWAAANGIVGGYGNGKYGPNDDITREQMAVILANYIKAMGYSLPSNAKTAFNDESDIASWALDAVKMMQAAGIVSGKPGGRYDPKGIATRAEIATILARFIEVLSGGASGQQTAAMAYSANATDVYIDKSAQEAIERLLAAADSGDDLA
jgi:hypothetical protein